MRLLRPELFHAAILEFLWLDAEAIPRPPGKARRTGMNARRTSVSYKNRLDSHKTAARERFQNHGLGRNAVPRQRGRDMAPRGGNDMKYGFNLLLWTGHVTDEHMPVLKALKKTGYDGVEIPIFEGTPDHYARLGERLAKLD